MGGTVTNGTAATFWVLWAVLIVVTIAIAAVVFGTDLWENHCRKKRKRMGRVRRGRDYDPPRWIPPTLEPSRPPREPAPLTTPKKEIPTKFEPQFEFIDTQIQEERDAHGSAKGSRAA